jgi:lysophospholipase L1-like esterase
VVSLATDQFASSLTLGESLARRQMSAADFPLLVRKAKLDQTTASTYLFAHFSNWLADKGFIRQDVLILLVPNFRELAARIADHGPHISDPSVLLAMAQQRLPELHDLAQTYGIKIVLLVPPTLRPDHSQEIQEIGDKAGVPVWVLSPPGEFPRDLFRDGFHLNLQGSEIFTARLAHKIRENIGNPVSEH